MKAALTQEAPLTLTNKLKCIFGENTEKWEYTSNQITIKFAGADCSQVLEKRTVGEIQVEYITGDTTQIELATQDIFFKRVDDLFAGYRFIEQQEFGISGHDTQQKTDLTIVDCKHACLNE